MKEKFISGLMFLAPIAIVVEVVSYCISLLTSPLHKVVSSFFHWVGLFPKGLLCFSHEQLLSFFSTLAILLSLAFFSTIVGYIGSRYVRSPISFLLDDFLFHIPLVKKIYLLCKRITAGLFIEKRSATASLHSTQFTSSEALSLSIRTNTVLVQRHPHQPPREYAISLFLSTPNPTGAYLTLTPIEKETPIRAPLDQAFRFIISCGASPFPNQQVK